MKRPGLESLCPQVGEFGRGYLLNLSFLGFERGWAIIIGILGLLSEIMTENTLVSAQ